MPFLLRTRGVLVYVIVGLPIVLATVIGAIHLSRRFRGGREEASNYLNCPQCRQRTAFRPSQAGHKGVCRRCGTNFLFPQPGAKVTRHG